MLIKVLPVKSNSKMDEKDVTIYLLRDNWNDFSFQTLYHLFLSAHHTENGEPLRFGEVKILKKGQTDSDSHQLDVGTYKFLNRDFCSLGQSLDYYERIASLKGNHKNAILTALNDVIYKPEIKKIFEGETGWQKSLMRGIKEDDDIFTLSPYLINKDYNSIPNLELKLSFFNSGMERPVEFDFDAPSYGYANQNKLPCRMNVIVGQNGSGKSSILSKISRVAFSSSKERQSEALSLVGKITPDGIGFPKIIGISYSAFDSFQIPGVSIADKKQILSDMLSGKGRYVFCGIRDICHELREYISFFDEKNTLPDKEIVNDRVGNTKLKPIESMCEEISTLFKLIKSKKRVKSFTNTIKMLSQESSFKEIESQLLEAISNESLEGIFFRCSTGHKFVIHSLMNIIAHAEKRSLILMDEPETHLHPPLLATFMTAIRKTLDTYDSFCIVATHSPIVVQETLSQHVHIMKRHGNKIEFFPPDIETYGENLSTITNLVFSLSGDYTEFHKELDSIIVEHIALNKHNDMNTIFDYVDTLFNHGLSMQARSYVMSKIVSELG